jgi:hypothetical protein
MFKNALDRITQSLGRTDAPIPRDPVLVFGNQKSGTSAVANLLAELCGLSATIDDPPIRPDAMREFALGQADFRAFVQRHPREFSAQLIKHPNLTFFTDRVLEVFDQARVVFVVRDPRDNIRSILQRRKVPGDLEQIDAQQMSQIGGPAMYDPRLWGGEGENYIGHMALRWNTANDAYLRNAQRFVLCRYEDFMADKLGVLNELARKLQLAPKHDIRARLDVQFQPAGDHSIPWSEFFGPRNLARIETLCAERMAKFGYR